jgi:hypothetical protein
VNRPHGASLDKAAVTRFEIGSLIRSDVAWASLDVREVGAVDAGAPGELPVREAQRLMSLFDREAEPRADVRAGLFDNCGQARIP